MMKTLVVLLGPTGVGKTSLSLRLAERLGSPVLNADSRQLYRDIPIGTAAPTEEQQRRVQHYFVGTLGLEEYYSAARFEADVMGLLPRLFAERDAVLLSGGSMLYMDAVCNGIDEMPTVLPETRALIRQRYEEEGLAALSEELRELDPVYFAEVDRRNTQRVLHALEICCQTGRPYTSFRTNTHRERPFRVVKIGLRREREELFARINRRVDMMMEQGLLEEAQRVWPFRHYNSLNTVGFKELFRHFSGEWELSLALDRMRKNTRVYAKKQLTWFGKDPLVHWIHPDDTSALDALLRTHRL